MEDSFSELKIKHKDFIKKIKDELVKEEDYYGNARRIENYLEIHITKEVEDYEEKKLILQKLIEDYDGSAQYESYLDQLDAPRWYLEKTYPTFYKAFKERFEKFLEEWKTSAKLPEINKQYAEELFINFCRYIKYEINNELYLKDILEDIEKNVIPAKVAGKKNMDEITFRNLVETLFELPDLIMYSFKNEKDKIEKKIAELSNRYGKYDKKIFKRAYELQASAKESRRSLTDENAIIEANSELLIFKSEELINEFGQRLPLLMKIAKSYSNYWKPKLKEGFEL